MAFDFQKTYRPEIEQLLCQYYQSLSEKDRRRFAALEAIKLGHGGIRYIAEGPWMRSSNHQRRHAGAQATAR